MRPRIRTAAIVQDLLDVVHEKRVKLVTTTYPSMNGKCTFIDVDYGEFVAYLGNVLSKGSGHPKRGIENRKRTNLERYGSTCSLNDPEVRAKAQQTCVENYGVTNPFQSDVIKRQIAEDNVAKYGVPNPLQREDVKRKVEATNLERYGVACTLNARIVLEKIAQTNLASYGVENPIQNSEVSKRALATAKKLYLVKHWKTGEELICAASYELAFVSWCNAKQIDFDWQIPFETPLLTKRGKRSTYFVDVFIKTGEFAGTWIEIKGRFTNSRNREKWEWFHATNPNSQLWTKDVLIARGILDKKGRPVKAHQP